MTPLKWLGLIFILSLSSCGAISSDSSETLTDEDRARILRQQQNQSRNLIIMDHRVPLLVQLPLVEAVSAALYLDIGDMVRLLDSTRFRGFDQVEYFFVEEPATRVQGYVAINFLIDPSFEMGMTLSHATHHFTSQGSSASSSLHLPAFHAIFSPRERGTSSLIRYEAIDLHGYRLDGYIDRSLLSFNENILRTMRLYRRAFYSSNAEEQLDRVNQLLLLEENIFTPLAYELAALRDFDQLGPDVEIFRWPQTARLRNIGIRTLIPAYARPTQNSMILGYLHGESDVELLAGYLILLNENPSNAEALPYHWYLVANRGWILSTHIEAIEIQHSADLMDLLEAEQLLISSMEFVLEIDENPSLPTENETLL